LWRREKRAFNYWCIRVYINGKTAKGGESRKTDYKAHVFSMSLQNITNESAKVKILYDYFVLKELIHPKAARVMHGAG
jgi:hypothetical protein